MSAIFIRSAVIAEISFSALIGLEASESFLTNLLLALLSYGIGERLLSFLSFFFLPFLEGLDFGFLVLGTTALVAFFFPFSFFFFFFLVLGVLNPKLEMSS